METCGHYVWIIKNNDYSIAMEVAMASVLLFEVLFRLAWLAGIFIPLCLDLPVFPGFLLSPLVNCYQLAVANICKIINVSVISCGKSLCIL